MASFRPLTTRGAFVPDSVIGARARSFQGLGLPRTQGFVSGLAFSTAAERPAMPAPRPPEDEAPPELQAAPEGDAAAAPAAAEPEAPTGPAPEPIPAELEALLRQNQELAAEYAEREKVRAAEHDQLVADLDAQKAKTKATNERLGQLAGELVRLRELMLQELRAHAGTLMLAGARKLAGESLQAQPGLLEGLVRETVDTLACGGITVRVNPDDVERVRTAMGEGVRVLGDARVRAGCVAEGEAGLVDATVDTAAGSLLAEVQAWKRTG